MRKILIALLATITIIGVATYFTSNRYATGEVLTTTYSEELDITITEIITKDGNIYELHDYTAPYFTPMLIHFDTMNTNDVTDDEIASIICFTKFR